MQKKQVIIIGAGPSGLFCSYLLLKTGFKVSLFEKTGGAAKKYLIAGHSGLNITNTEDIETFISKFSPTPSIITDAIKNYPPIEIEKFYNETLETETFSGSTGHVFPVDMKAGKPLINWLNILKSFEDFELITNIELTEITNKKEITLKKADKYISRSADYFVYALGGASWKKTGSSGDWVSTFEKQGVGCIPFHPENCGYLVEWSKHFKENIGPTPLKNISLSFQDNKIRGEVLINEYGVEGQAIYKLTHAFSRTFKASKKPIIEIDMLPDLELHKVEERLNKLDYKMSFSTRMKKAFKFSKGEILLINEYRNSVDLNDKSSLAKLLKSLKIELTSPRPIDEAISTSGGISLSELDSNFELKKLPNHFCLGEMLDWSAPTGGYLLTACMSSAYSAALEIIKRN